MNLQQILAKSPRREAWMELCELGTGLLLLGFLQFHLLAVSSIIFGAAAFNRDSARMDEYYISYVGIPLVILAILAHGLLAMRKAPWKFQEMRVFLQHSRRLAHLDTWAWGVQIVTGLIILVLAAIHIAQVLHTWPIEAASSAARIQGGCFSHFVLLLLAAEIHAMVGLYRILVKWGWFHRKKFTPYLVYATIGFVGLGFVTLLFFYFRQIAKGLS
ncbi:MAG: succinate dehydrogenase [Pseudomonadota bacterium]